MLFITQLIYIVKGEEAAFHQFEDMAMSLISKYNGKLLLRVRPDADAMIEGSMEAPYEIHLVQFEAETDFHAFMQDRERKQFLHLKERSVRSVFLIRGEQLSR